MRRFVLTTAVVAAAIGLAGCSKTPPPESVPVITYDTFTDSRDGQMYRTVVIGDDRWMAENLNYKTDSSWCYENNADSCKKYGRLYTWDAAMKACPAGYHLPSRMEWYNLGQTVDGERKPYTADNYYVGDVDWLLAGKKLKAESGWSDCRSENCYGTDDYGFSAIPGGLRSYVYGGFEHIGYLGYWWTSTAAGNSDYACVRNMSYNYDYMGKSYMASDYGLSVRCVADTP